MVQSELIHGRVAMTGVAGILFTSVRGEPRCACCAVPRCAGGHGARGQLCTAGHPSDWRRPPSPLPQLAHAAGQDIPEWYEAGKVYMERNPDVSFGALVYTTIILSGWAEAKRWQDWLKPGSQADGSFLGITGGCRGWLAGGGRGGGWVWVNNTGWMGLLAGRHTGRSGAWCSSDGGRQQMPPVPGCN